MLDPSKPNSFFGQNRNQLSGQETPTYAAVASSPAGSNPTHATSNTVNAPPLPAVEDNLNAPLPVIDNSNAPLPVIDEIEDDNCPMCRVDVAADAHGIICDTCNVWYHAECLNMS